MKFGNLMLERFKLFRTRQVFPLLDQGLVMVKGDNRVSQACSGNGVGKTSIVDGIMWVLKGHTTRDEEAADVACRFDEGPCYGALEITPDEKRWVTAIRQARPSAFRLLAGRLHTLGDHVYKQTGEHIKTVQARLEDLVPYGDHTLLNGMIFGQETFRRFARSTVTEQMAMMDELQGMNWKHVLQTAKSFRDEWAKHVEGERTKWSEATATANVLGEQVLTLTEMQQQFAQAKATRVAEAQARLEQVVAERKTLEAQQELWMRKQTRLKELKQIWATATQVENGLDMAQDNWHTVSNEANQAHAALVRLETEMTQLLKAGRCPKCRTIFKGQEATVRKAFAAEITKANTLLVRKRRAQDIAKGIMDGAIAQLARIKTKLPAGFDKVMLVRMEEELRQTAVTQIALASKDVAIRTATDAVKAERAAKWSGAAALETAQRQVAAARAAELAAEQSMAKAQRGERRCAYWVEAFGDRGIRNLMFDSIRDYLNQRWAHHLNVLCCGEATAELDPQAVSRSGKVKDKLTVKAEWSWGANTYKSGSGGQDRRVDLALFAAVQDVSERMSAKPFPVKFWDQPDDDLDARGQEVFCQWIEQEVRARSTGVVITHNQELAGVIRPDSVWTIVLERNGSRVEIA